MAQERPSLCKTLDFNSVNLDVILDCKSVIGVVIFDTGSNKGEILFIATSNLCPTFTMGSGQGGGRCAVG